MPLWTIEVFTDPSTCADRIAGYLGLENVMPPGRGTAAGGFFDEDLDSQRLGTAENDRNEYQAERLESEEVVVNAQNPGQAGTEGDDQPDPEGNGQAPAPEAQQTGTAAILPNKAAEDDPRNWGDGTEDDHDAWLKENKPPHWGG
jgi:hypothetical protein